MTGVEERAAALLRKVLDDRRIRHDHAYPIEVGPHHCDGCDLITEVTDLLAQPTADEADGDEHQHPDAGLRERVEALVEMARHANRNWRGYAIVLVNDLNDALAADTQGGAS